MSKQIKARFYVASTTRQAYAMANGGKPVGSVTLQAVTRKTDDNVDWAQSTPGGSLQMTVNGSALEIFDSLLGKDVYLLISEIPDEAPTA